ncbi:unnamed protein product [Adineta ricciae]|uniref:Uncharacterized protein n=1 Tax=Adineta ricciae TaxID=249248 RepID=A0A815KET2_ADIRI|nr:unnamed protein product [Adineta ricciae]
MQYEQGTEKVFMASAPTISSNDDRQLQRTRKILLIVFGIFLGLSIFSLAMLLMGVPTTTYGLERNYTPQIVQTILSIAFYSFAYYVAHNYHPIGLRVVAWIMIIAAVFLCLSTIGLFILLIVIMAGVEFPRELQSLAVFGGVLLSIFAVVCLIVLIVEIILIKLCFKLARLIDARNTFSHQQTHRLEQRINMQYKEDVEKVAMMNSPTLLSPRPLGLKDNDEVQRTRKFLLIILGVCLALSVASAVSAIPGSSYESETGTTRRSSQVGENFVAILFYTFGIVVAYNYYQTGLRVFAYLGVIILGFAGIAAVIFLFLGISALVAVSQSGKGQYGFLLGASIGAFLFVILLVANVILTVIIVKFAFKLARLIEASERLAVQPV